MEHIIETIFLEYKGSLHPLQLFPEINDRSDILHKISEQARLSIIKEADSHKNYFFPSLSASEFMKFYRTGNRIDYEEIYFSKRRILNTFVLAEYIENQGRFLDNIVDGIFSLCEESAWQLPAHNTYIRDTPAYPLPDTSRPVLDLFSCETGALLATIYKMLKTSLDKLSPFITERINQELQKRIILPYLSEHFWWMGKENEPMNNWTIWCTQNILLTASQIPLSYDTYQKIIEKSCKSVDFFLKEYAIDGCCDEGALYYHHAASCLFLAIHSLNQICENAFSSVWNLPKIKNMGEYIYQVYVGNNYYLNFADCSPIVRKSGAREFLFGKFINSNELSAFAAKNYAEDEDPYLSDEINLTYRFLSLFFEVEIRTYAMMHPFQLPTTSVWYESTGLMIMRTKHTCLAIKAGNNGESHNHNDTGSLILYYNYQPILIDVGVMSYTKDTFSANRYHIWCMQSGFHNLPTICNKDQLPGTEYAASDLVKTASSLTMNIADAYPKECGLSYYKRTVQLPSIDYNQSFVLEENQNHSEIITITDQFAFNYSSENNTVFVNFMTYEKPSFHNGILKIGSYYAFMISGIDQCYIEEIPITDKRLQIAWKHNIFRIRFSVTDSIFSMRTVFL